MMELTCSVDSEEIAALYQEGVLTIKMPKRSSAGRRRIEIAIE